LAPLDTPEADTELVAGPLTEYSGRGLALFRLAKDAALVVGLALVAAFYRCAEAVDADVVLMSTHALRWPGQANVGCVADGVLRCGRRPVLMVRREPPAGDNGPVSESAGFAWS
jgi:hypothetical protein